MAVPTIALYASPPSSVCSTPYPYQINSHGSYDFDFNSRSSSSSSTATASSSQKAIVGGLSSLFSSSSSFSTGGAEDMALYRGGDELSNSLSYSSFGSCLKRDHFHQSPVSVIQGPLSCTPSMRFSPERDGFTCFRVGTRRLFKGSVTVTHALGIGSCVDYSPGFRMNVNLAEELTFSMDDNNLKDNNLKESIHDPYAKDMLLSAQLKHNIFNDELVIKAFYEAAKAHRGQMRASGDPYLQHCVETACLLATIGADAMVVSAGLLHDTLDDSDMNREHILQSFGPGLADLVEGEMIYLGLI